MKLVLCYCHSLLAGAGPPGCQGSPEDQILFQKIYDEAEKKGKVRAGDDNVELLNAHWRAGSDRGLLRPSNNVAESFNNSMKALALLLSVLPPDFPRDCVLTPNLHSLSSVPGRLAFVES